VVALIEGLRRRCPRVRRYRLGIGTSGYGC